VRLSTAVSLRLLWRFIVIWLIETVALLFLATRFPGVDIASPRSPAIFLSAALVAFAMSIINTLIQPLLIILRLPVNALSIGVVAIVVNGSILRLAAANLPGFDIDPFVPTAVIAALLMALINTVLTALIALDDEYAYFQFAMHMLVHGHQLRRALHPTDTSAAQSDCGMVIVQIDGLSPKRLRYAIDQGLMPTLGELLATGTHCLMTFDCGLPSQTSACQSGIMYGHNSDIPAFRWYDKKLRRMFVSNHLNDANSINNASSTGHGLLRGGSSINNLVNGDAAKSLLTLSTLTGHSNVPTVRALDDLSSFWFNPYTFTRTLFGSIGDLLVEVLESARQFVRNEWPRIDRLFNGQVFLRVLTNIFLRDLSAYVMMLDISRGVPIIYATFMGYDQVAHHAGPDSSDALYVLRGLDKQLRHVLQTTRLLAPNPYQLYVLSDHGQAFGATFRQRYSMTLRDLVDRLTDVDTKVAEVNTAEDKTTYTTALIHELDAAKQQMESQPNTRFRRAVMQSAARTLERSTLIRAQDGRLSPSQVIVCVSGNLAHIYFAMSDSKVSLSAIENAHPKLVRGLVEHAGIGIVTGYSDDGDVIVLSKEGARNLGTGAVTGHDPLAPYGDPDLRAAQLLRIAEFPNSGDLIINSTVFTDDTVASFENLIGVHGGLGGQQTEAFILYPTEAHLSGDGIVGASQVFELLDRQRQCAEVVA
jgi:uncharacterized membrane protein YvlD (DUF360 family)